jgi:hypothetical protein
MPIGTSKLSKHMVFIDMVQAWKLCSISTQSVLNYMKCPPPSLTEDVSSSPYRQEEMFVCILYLHLTIYSLASPHLLVPFYVSTLVCYHTILEKRSFTDPSIANNGDKRSALAP